MLHKSSVVTMPQNGTPWVSDKLPFSDDTPFSHLRLLMGRAWSLPEGLVKQNALLVTLGTSFEKERKRL